MNPRALSVGAVLRTVAALCLAFVVPPAFAATSGRQEIIGYVEGVPHHHIVVSTLPENEAQIVIDGRVDEPLWQQLPRYDNMLVYVPGTSAPAQYPTELRLFATDQGLFVSAVLYQPPDTLVARMTNRDDFIDRDSFGFTLDTTGQGLFAYWFITALGDSLTDGKVLPEYEYQSDWDGTWIAKTARFEGGWSVELLLPWSMMDLPKIDGPRTFGFATNRQVSHTTEQYQWPGYPYASSRLVTALNTMEVSGIESRQQYYHSVQLHHHRPGPE